MKKSLADLPYATVYIVRGPVDKLSWELQNVPQPELQIIHNASNSELAELIRWGSDLFRCRSTYMVLPPKKLLFPRWLEVHPDVRAFIWISNLDGSLTPAMEKVYKTHSTGAFRTCDLRQTTYEEDTKIQNLLSRHSEELQTWALQEFAHKPFVLKRILSTDKPKENKPDDSLTTKDLIDFIWMLGTPESLKFVDRLTSAEIYHTFVMDPTHPEDTSLAKVLCGKQRSSAGLCPTLWFWYEQHYSANYKSFLSNPKAFLKLWVTWVFLASTVWSKLGWEGINHYTNKRNPNRKFLSFKASREAVTMFRSTILGTGVTRVVSRKGN